MTLTKENLSVSTWTWHSKYYTGDLSLLDAPRLVNKAGLQTVELNDFMLPPGRFSRLRNWAGYLWGYRKQSRKMLKYVGSTLKKLKSELDKNQVECLSWTIDSDFTVDDIAWRDELAYIISGFKTAEQLNAKFLRLTLGGAACMGPEIDPLVISRLKFVSAVAQHLFPNIEPVVENHWGISTEPTRFLALLDHVPNIGICFDPGNTPKVNQEINWRLLASRTKLFHLKIYDLDKHHIDQHLDYRTVFQILHEQNYSGKFVIEYEGDGNPDQVLAQLLNGLSDWRDSGFRRMPRSVPKSTPASSDSLPVW